MVEHLLVPIDGGSLSERAIDASVGLARQLRAAITGLIVEPFTTGRVTDDGDLELLAHAQRVLRRFDEVASAQGVPFRGIATQASEVGAAIVDAALENRCDMIVMASRGRSAIAELLWGSNTRQVMALTRLPVLVLH
jgi:nucleotide-binding universal stress UspA family protein